MQLEQADSRLGARQRYIAVLEYNGSRYHGWQRLKSGRPTIQQALEEALSRVADHPVQVVCAGRTDAGVHACRQVVHFDSAAKRALRSWLQGANRYLPGTVRVLDIAPAPESFHARFSAIARRYRYVIFNRPVASALAECSMAWNYHPLDEKVMHRSAQALTGEHDFTSYRTVRCQARNPVRHVHFIRVWREHDKVVIDIQANAFLHHMVRNIAGVLQAIGAGNRNGSWAEEILKLKDRNHGGVTAKPEGLYFISAFYAPMVCSPSDIVTDEFCRVMDSLILTCEPDSPESEKLQTTMTPCFSAPGVTV